VAPPAQKGLWPGGRGDFINDVNSISRGYLILNNLRTQNSELNFEGKGGGVEEAKGNEL